MSPKRVLRWVFAVAALGAAIPASAASDHGHLQHELDILATRARPGVLGIAVFDLESGAAWQVNAARDYPMMSVFKAPIAAAVLDRIDRRGMSLEQPIAIARADLSVGASKIRDRFQGAQMTFSVADLLRAMVVDSDNTAADVLIREVGGPSVLTAFLRDHDIADMRIEMDERAVGRLASGLSSGARRPANESRAQAHERELRGYRAFLTKRPNPTTPTAAVAFLRKLWRRELLSPAGTEYLLNLMYGQIVPARFSLGLPRDIRVAQKTGTSGDGPDGHTGAFNDIAFFTWPNSKAVAVAAFLTDLTDGAEGRDRLFADIAHAVAIDLAP